jgi:histidine phosphotransferase ChpT
MTSTGKNLIDGYRPGPHQAEAREREHAIQTARRAPIDSLDLAEAMATRICHDLAGLCGTLTGALELITEDGGEAGEAASIANESAQRIADRVRLLRAAWGGGTETLDPTGIEALAPGLPAAQRLTVSASGLAAQTPLPGGLAQVVLNAILLASESLPRGGTIALSGSEACISIRIAGLNARWPTELGALLAARADPRPDFAEPHRMQAPMLALLARRAGLVLRLRPTEGGADVLDIQSPAAG